MKPYKELELLAQGGPQATALGPHAVPLRQLLGSWTKTNKLKMYNHDRKTVINEAVWTVRAADLGFNIYHVLDKDFGKEKSSVSFR